MDTLLLQLAGPLQSWGVQAKFDNRTSSKAPTKSGVIGMIAAAQGRRRNEKISDLAEGLRFGVRTDQPGRAQVDYQTAQGKSAYVTYRHYLADAIFLVGFEGKRELLEEVKKALENPYYPLFLGRRSCPPVGKLVLEIAQDMSLEEALSTYPWLGRSNRYRPRKEVSCECTFEVTKEAQDSAQVYLPMQPLSFSQEDRRYAPLGLRRELVILKLEQTEPITSHDPMGVLGGEA